MSKDVNEGDEVLVDNRQAIVIEVNDDDVGVEFLNGERRVVLASEVRGCGKQPDVEEHEQDAAVTIALAALSVSKEGTKT